MARLKCEACGFMTDTDAEASCGACGEVFPVPEPLDLTHAIHEHADFIATMEPEYRLRIVMSGGREFAFSDEECFRLYKLFRTHLFFADFEAMYDNSK